MRARKMLGIGAVVLRFGLLVGICFIILYPLLRQFSAAVMHPDDMYDLTVNWIPRQLTKLNFEVAWNMLDYPRSLLNTSGSDCAAQRLGAGGHHDHWLRLCPLALSRI
ncbi:MAG: hypothetical protein ACOX46_02830 [Limnochordia bacterium]